MDTLSETSGETLPSSLNKLHSRDELHIPISPMRAPMQVPSFSNRDEKLDSVITPVDVSDDEEPDDDDGNDEQNSLVSSSANAGATSISSSHSLSRKRVRIKFCPTLVPLCQKHGTTTRESNIQVCEGRKSVHILDFGRIDSINCFLNESPSASYRSSKKSATSFKMAQSTWKSLVIPNGWKVAAYIHGELWVAEVSYRLPEGIPQYQFTKLNEGGESSESSGWQKTPSAAFNASVISRKTEKPLRHNGKLFLGVHYESPQARLREHFNDKRDSVAGYLRPLLDAWLNNDPLPEVASPPVATLKRPSIRLDSANETQPMPIKLPRLTETASFLCSSGSNTALHRQPSISPPRSFANPAFPLLGGFPNSCLELFLPFPQLTLPPSSTSSLRTAAGLNLPLPFGSILPHHNTAISNSDVENRTVFVKDVHQSFVQLHPELSLESVRDLVMFAPFATWDPATGDWRIRKEDFVDFLESVEKFSAQFHDWIQHHRADGNKQEHAIGDQHLQAYLTFLTASGGSLTTIQQRVARFMTYAFTRSPLIVATEATPLLDLVRSVTGLPSSKELQPALSRLAC